MLQRVNGEENAFLATKENAFLGGAKASTEVRMQPLVSQASLMTFLKSSKLGPTQLTITLQKHLLTS